MAYPETVYLKEVAPRDGWQKFKKFIPTDEKISLIQAMIDYGIKELEVGVFDSDPKLAWQYTDIEQVCAEIVPYAAARGVQLNCIASDEQSIARAAACGIPTVDYFISVSDAFGRGFGAAPDEAFQILSRLIRNSGSQIRLALGAVFGCPFGDGTPISKTISYIKRAQDLGVTEFGLADSAGKGDPRLTEAVLSAVLEHIGPEHISLHIHNTEGFGFANCYKALEMGLSRFDTSLAGMGGCPVIPNAKGNLPTEDFVNLLQKLKIKTGIDLEACTATSLKMSIMLDAPVISRMAENTLLRGKNTRTGGTTKT